jgi:hypothetical protein
LASVRLEEKTKQISLIFSMILGYSDLLKVKVA